MQPRTLFQSASDSSEDDSDSSDDDSDSSEDGSDSSEDDCARLSSFIDFDLQPVFLGFESFAAFSDALVGEDDDFVGFNTSRVEDAATSLFMLLESTPTLFANLSAQINESSGQFVLDGGFRSDQNEAVFATFANLSSEFVAVASEVCSTVLTESQLNSTNELFTLILPTSLYISLECAALNETIVENAIATADGDNERAVVAIVGISTAVSGTMTVLLALISICCRIANFIDSNPGDPATASTMAQELLDDFVFQISDRCGVPLSNSSLALLNRYYLEELVDSG